VRPLTATTIVLALCIACGNSTPPVASVGSGQPVLHISTAGDGMVRGAGPDCRGNCTFTPAAGTQARLEAIADPGATFAGWSGACSGTGACQVTVNGDVSVTATFTRPSGTSRLTVVVEGQGRVVSSPAGIDCTSTTCSALFADGTAVSLAATSAPGAKFAGWGVGCSGPGACSLTMRGDVQVFAHFDTALPPPQVTLTATVSGPGMVTGGALICGDGAKICAATMAPGTAVTLTASASAQARFMGWGGACSGNAATCQLTVQSDTSVAASFAFEVQTLVANDGTNIFTIGLNSTQVFFARRAADGSSSIYSVPKSGGTPARVAAGFPTYIVADDAFVYWTDGSAVYSAPVGGGDASQLAVGNVGRLALDEFGALYWIYVRSSSQNGAVHRMQNRVDAVIASGQNQNSAVAVDAAFAYFTTAAINGTGRAIRRVPRSGGTVETVVTTAADPMAIRVDFQDLYYRESTGAVRAVAKTGGTPRLLSTGNTASSTVPFVDLDVNASVAWWTWNDFANGARGLFRANADGSGWTAVEQDNSTVWFGPRVDDTAVYYFRSGALLKRLK
jgi:Divergent InlB B-repeat domain